MTDQLSKTNSKHNFNDEMLKPFLLNQEQNNNAIITTYIQNCFEVQLIELGKKDKVLCDIIPKKPQEAQVKTIKGECGSCIQNCKGP